MLRACCYSCSGMAESQCRRVLALARGMGGCRPCSINLLAERPAVHVVAVLLLQLCDLPAQLLVCILRHLPQSDRLTNCAAVSKSWAAAANAATTDVKLTTATDKAMSSFQTCLLQHAGQLRSIKLVRSPSSDCLPLELPCAELQQLYSLTLTGVDVNMASPNAPDMAVLPSLKALKLEDCQFSDSTAAQLPQLSGVTRFKLTDDSGCERAIIHHLPAALQRLPALAYLTVPLNSGYGVNPDIIIPMLPAGTLTSLTWTGCNGLSDSISHLVHLQKLKLLGCDVVPAELTRLTQLLHLELAEGYLLGDVADLLSAVGGMLQLRHLCVTCWQDSTDAEPPFVLSGAEPSHCAALTASANLTYLELGYCAAPASHSVALHVPSRQAATSVAGAGSVELGWGVHSCGYRQCCGAAQHHQRMPCPVRAQHCRHRESRG